jgi:hypothetical protein
LALPLLVALLPKPPSVLPDTVAVSVVLAVALEVLNALVKAVEVAESLAAAAAISFAVTPIRPVSLPVASCANAGAPKLKASATADAIRVLFIEVLFIMIPLTKIDQGSCRAWHDPPILIVFSKRGANAAAVHAARLSVVAPICEHLEGKTKNVMKLREKCD